MNNMEIFFKLLDDNTEETLALAIRLTAPIPLFKVDTGWTGIQVLEHIYLTDKVVADFLFQPPKGIATHSHIVGPAELRRMLVLESQPVQAPPAVIPSGTINSIAQFELAFKGLRTQLKKRLLSETDLPENRYYHTPLMGNLTLTDWLFFMIYHTERHLDQLRRMQVG